MVQGGLGITITTKRNYLSLPEQVVSRELKPNTFREINIAVLGKVHQKKRMPLSKRLVLFLLTKMLRYQKERNGRMPFVVGYGIAIIGALIAYQLSKGKTKKRQYIVWGITLMLAISPFLSFAIGLTYAAITENGWAALIMWYIFPVIFVIGLIVLLIGIFKKKEHRKEADL